MKHILIAIAGLVGVLLMTSPAIAQQRGSPTPTRLFDPPTMTTVRGIVARIDSVRAPHGGNAEDAHSFSNETPS